MYGAENTDGDDEGEKTQHFDWVWYYNPDLFVVRPKIGPSELEAII
jgi:hypothetical protein